MALTVARVGLYRLAYLGSATSMQTDIHEQLLSAFFGDRTFARHATT